MIKSLTCSLCLFSFSFMAQTGAIVWQKSFGGSATDHANTIIATSDGGYLIAGSTASSNGDVTGHHGGTDFWVVKTDASGNFQWQKTYGGSGNDDAYSVIQTSDGGYIIGGNTTSTDGDVTGQHGNSDIWIVKTDGAGTLQWQRALGGNGIETIGSVELATSGGYIVLGTTQTVNNGDVTGNHTIADYWVAKLGDAGTLKWQLAYGGNLTESGRCIKATNDGGYIMGGISFSNNINVPGNHGSADFWILKTDSTGGVQWKKCIGGTGYESLASISQTSDKGFIMTGYSQSKDSIIPDNHGVQDFYVVKTDSLGTIQWQKSLGGTNDDEAAFGEQTPDGGFIISGYTYSVNDDVSGNHGDMDLWLVKLNAGGSIQWQQTYGTTGSDAGTCAHATAGGGFIVSGWTNSSAMVPNQGLDDFWVIKLDGSVNVEELAKSLVVTIYPNPATDMITIRQDNPVANQPYALHDMAGEMITNGMLQEQSTVISLSGLAPGVYFLRIGSSAQKVYKIVKLR